MPLARSFKIVNPDLKSPMSDDRDQAFKLFDRLLQGRAASAGVALEPRGEWKAREAVQVNGPGKTACPLRRKHAVLPARQVGAAGAL